MDVKILQEYMKDIDERTKDFEQPVLPEKLLDEGGYPTDEWLNFLRKYRPNESLPLEDFVYNVLPQGWWPSGRGCMLLRKYKGKRKLELHTGGWIGNEEVAAAIKSNKWLIFYKMQYVKWRAGGHHYFDVYID